MQMTGSLARLLNQYINDELYDFHYYMEVAKKVDKPEAKRMIEEIACDEYQHARLLTDYYVRLTVENLCLTSGKNMKGLRNVLSILMFPQPWKNHPFLIWT